MGLDHPATRRRAHDKSASPTLSAGQENRQTRVRWGLNLTCRGGASRNFPSILPLRECVIVPQTIAHRMPVRVAAKTGSGWHLMPRAFIIPGAAPRSRQNPRPARTALGMTRQQLPPISKTGPSNGLSNGSPQPGKLFLERRRRAVNSPSPSSDTVRISGPLEVYNNL